METALLSISNLNVDYGQKNILKNINLNVNKGEILGIVGESGSGKSTLIKTIMRLNDKHFNISKGCMLYKGENILTKSNEELRKLRGPEIGMIFQNCGASLCPIRNIGDQIYESVSQHKKISKKEVLKLAIDVFDKINLKDSDRILKSYSFELSGGMNQRVGIAMAIMLNPSLLLADEPTSALDVSVQAMVIKELLKIRDIFGTSIIMVSHNISVVSYMADNIAIMKDGLIIEYGDKNKILNNPKNDYTKSLLKSVPKLKGK